MGWNIINLMASDQETHEYRPTRLSRRGEVIAWVLALIVGAVWLGLSLSGNRVGVALPLLEAFLLFAALSISLGNWMDRKTVLRLDHAGVSYTNGLRQVRFDWSKINQLRIYPGGWGKRVQVLGESADGKPAYFGFRTFGIVRVQGEVKGQMGFEAGDEIVSEMIRRSGLQVSERSQNSEIFTRL